MYKISKIAYILPSFFLVFLIIFSSSYNSLLYFGEYTPFYELVIVFYWCFYLPRLLPILLLVLIGVFRDYFMMSPIGISSLSFVILSLMSQKSAVILKDKSFISVFIIFVLNIVIIASFKITFLLFYLDSSFMLLSKLFVYRVFSTVLLYVPIHFIFELIRNKISKIEDGN